MHLCLQVGVVPGRFGVDDVEAQGPVEDAVVVEGNVIGGVSGELLKLLGEKHGCRHVFGIGVYVCQLVYLSAGGFKVFSFFSYFLPS